jgi:cytochrome c oxidase cbb3-type subunit 3
LRTPLTVIVIAAAVVTALAGCEREKRQFQTAEGGRLPLPQVRGISIQPGTESAGVAWKATLQSIGDAKDYDKNAYAASQGKQLFRWYNCSGCHGPGGGGGSGPPLSDALWFYGSSPQNIYASIVEGRPNGMPSFGGHITEDQLWQLVAYVRSMSGQLRSDVAPSRSDSLQASKPEGRRERETPVPGMPQAPDQ